MSLEIEGHVVKILQEVTGQGQNGTWIKQEFVIETTGDYPKKVHFSTWGDKAREVKNLIEGEKVKISFEPSSREFNERWYTELRAWRIQKDQTGVVPASQQPIQQPPTAPPVVNEPPKTEPGDGDLPF